jgi:hypothetical protein
MPTESVPRAEPHLWTAWTDYFATGEGRTLLGLICSATSPEDARQRFGEVFDPYYASGCQVEKGVARNDATQFLWSEAALTALEELDPRAAVEAISRIHINLS